MHYVFHFVEEFDRLWKFVFRRNFPMEFPIVMYHLKWIIDNFPKNLHWEEMTVQDRNDPNFFFPSLGWTKGGKLTEGKSELRYRKHFDVLGSRIVTNQSE